MDFDKLLRSFRIQSDLERTIWGPNDKLYPEVRVALLRICKNFLESIKLVEIPPIKDIVFTGSLANYNYSKYSDIDVHILFDFGTDDAKKNLLERFFIISKSKWNDAHSVVVKKYEVEIYAEDYKNPHVSTGVYSVLNDKWIRIPEKKDPVIDKKDVISKINYFKVLYDKLESDFNNDRIKGIDSSIESLKEKIRKFRKAGLEKGGEFSIENITFKSLRRLGIIDNLVKLQQKVTDRKLSLESDNL
jgi:predicted nucleotidyltransferase